MNGYPFKVVRMEGDFVWHRHADTDETFIVLEARSASTSRTAPPASRPRRTTSGSETSRRMRLGQMYSLISSSAIWTALRAAPLRRLSLTTHSASPFSTVGSTRTRLTNTASWPVISLGVT